MSRAKTHHSTMSKTCASTIDFENMRVDWLDESFFPHSYWEEALRQGNVGRFVTWVSRKDPSVALAIHENLSEFKDVLKGVLQELTQNTTAKSSNEHPSGNTSPHPKKREDYGEFSSSEGWIEVPQPGDLSGNMFFYYNHNTGEKVASDGSSMCDSKRSRSRHSLGSPSPSCYLGRRKKVPKNLSVSKRLQASSRRRQLQ
eukprot:341064_1